MRDFHRMKDKYELSLDSGQLLSLLIAAAVVVSGVFFVGVMVGKRLSEREPQVAAVDPLKAVEHKPNEVQPAEPPLTFQDELTKKAVPEPREHHEPAAPKAVAAVPAGPSPEDEVEAKAPDAPTPETAKADEVAEAAPKPVKVVESSVTPAPALVTHPDAAVATRTTATAPTVKPTVHATQPVEAVANGAFTLQLAASQDRDEADRFASKLKDKGYAPYIASADVAGKGTWFRVRMGSFPTKDAANRYLQDFKRETKLDGFVAETK